MDNDISCNLNVCSNTFGVAGMNANGDDKVKVNLKSMYVSEKEKHTFTDFDRACNKIDFSDTVSLNSSLSSANMVYDHLGHHIDKNNNIFTSQLSMNNLASPHAFHDIEDCCIYGTESDDIYVWPLYGEVDNCIVHFTDTYCTDTWDTSTCIVYIQGSVHKGWFVWNQNIYSGKFFVTKCSNPPAGYLQIISNVNVSIVFHQPVDKAQAQLVHSNYVQDTFYHKIFGCSYVNYIENIIDKSSANQFVSDDATGGHHQQDNKVSGAVSPPPPPCIHA